MRRFLLPATVGCAALVVRVEFLNYKRSELRAIASGLDATKKEWLKEYLETCESSSGVKRELLSVLR